MDNDALGGEGLVVSVGEIVMGILDIAACGELYHFPAQRGWKGGEVLKGVFLRC